MSEENENENEPVPGKLVRLEYTGDKAGTVTYGPGNVPSGNKYPAGNNSRFKFVDVEPQDVNYMLSLGVFKKLDLSGKAQPPAPVDKAAAVAENVPVEADLTGLTVEEDTTESGPQGRRGRPKKEAE